MLRIAIRQHRAGLIGYAGFMVINILSNVGGFVSLNDTAAKREAFGAQMKLLAPSFSIFVPYPVRPDTLWGYAEWRGWGIGLLAFGIWAVVAGSGAVRGDEERGLLESWLATGLRRRRLVIDRAGAFAMALLLAIGLGGGGTSVVLAFAARVAIPWAGIAVQTLALAAISLFFFSLAAAFSSLIATRRNAGGAAATVMLAAFVLAGVARTADAVRPWRWISPFSYYDRVHALAPGGEVAPWAIVIPLAAAVAVGLLAAWLLHWRDVGGVLMPRRRWEAPPGVTPDPNPLYRLPVLPGLWDQRLGLSLWAGATLLDSFWLTSLSKPIYAAFDYMLKGGDADVMRSLLGVGAGGNPYAAIVGTVVLPQLLLVVSAFAIYQASRWASEDTDGRLEMLLASGIARWRVIGERAVALLAGASAVAAAGFLAVWLAARSSGLGIDGNRLLLAAALELPVALAFGFSGAALAAWRPRLAVAGIGAIAFASYFLPFAAPLFRWPDWVRRLSLFDLYGKPLVEGISWSGLAGTLAVAAAALAVAAALMQRREVGR